MQSEFEKSNETQKKTPLVRKLLSRRTLIGASLSTVFLATLPMCSELRIIDPYQPLTDEWSRITIQPHGSTLLGITFRPLQAQAFGLEIRPTLKLLLRYPIQVVRLGAYWNKIELKAKVFDTSELDWQLDAVEQVGAKIILCVGALKTFGFPEYFIPQCYMPKPFTDRTLITPKTHSELLDAASNFIFKIVDRYKQRESIVAWQLENEPADPLPFAHYWRLSTTFVKQELGVLRSSDLTKPVMINGYLATSLPVKIGQALLTRDQGDSLMLAQEVSDIVGVDYYPRMAISSLGSKNIYLNTAGVPWERGNWDSLAKWTSSHGKKIMVAEGQAEPWELAHIPPRSQHYAPYSCTPEDLIGNYNTCMNWTEKHSLYSYLFWGAEYWILRWHLGDQQYLRAFARVLENT